MGGRIPLPRTGGAPERSEGIVEGASTDVKVSKPFSRTGCPTNHLHHGKRMRTRALVLASILPIALAFAPSVAHGQRSVYRDCRGRFDWSPSHGCSYDAAAARAARQAADRARQAARAAASRVRAESRAYAAAARANARAWNRDMARDMSRARIRADELRNRLRDRMESRMYERRRPNYRRW
jgi:hypothetical protein